MKRFALAFLAVAACASADAKPITVEPQPPPITTPAPKAVRDPEPWVQHHLSGAQVDEISALARAHPPSECEPGQRKSCGFIMPVPPGLENDPEAQPHMQCSPVGDGRWVWNRGGCATPLVLAFDDAPIAFTRPGPGASTFTVGPYERTEWVSSKTPWLVLDANDNGAIDDQTELFGADGAAANGFDKLARLDDNRDGVIDASDAAYARLMLWADVNGDRRSSPGELTSLADAGVVAIDLAATTVPIAGASSYEGERAAIRFRDAAGELRNGRVVDVYLAPL